MGTSSLFLRATCASLLALFALLAPAAAQEEGGDGPPPPRPVPSVPRAVEFLELDLHDAVSRAERERKLLVVFWTHPSYRDVQRMRDTTWRDRDLAEWAERNALVVAVDGTAHTSHAAAYKVTAFPTVDLLDPTRGVGVERLQGYADADALLASFAGALVGGGPAPKPEGAALDDPYAWLAYANSKWRVEAEAVEAARAYGRVLRNGEAMRPGFRRRYFEFLLTRIAYLKPHAVQAFRILENERTLLEGRLLRGLVDERSVYELVRVDWWLRDPARTRATFLDLADRGDEGSRARGLLLRHVVHDLGRAGLTAEILAGFGEEDPAAWTRARFEAIEATLARQEAGETILAEEIDTRADAVLGASWTYDALLAKSRLDEAAALVDVLAEKAPTSRAFALLVDRARDREHYALARNVGERGLALLEEGQNDRQLRRALAKVPAGVSPPNSDR